jgi:hypothetical protein
MEIGQIILGVLSAIEAIIPLISAGGASSSAITKIITALQQFLPLLEKLAPIIGDEATLIYQGVRNIISNLRGTDTDAQQDADLDALDARVDAAWQKILPQFDPDAAPTPPKAA